MGIQFLPVWLDMVAVFFIGVALWWLFVATQYWFYNRDFVYVKGLNGNSGDVISLTCPVGTNIKLRQTHLQCADLDSSGKQPSCDPFLNDGTLNTSNIQTITSEIGKICNEKNTCEITIPSPTNSICTSCDIFQMVGTYTCST